MNHSTPCLRCPSQTPEVFSNSCPSSRWCHPAISSSVVLFSSCPLRACSNSSALTKTDFSQWVLSSCLTILPFSTLSFALNALVPTSASPIFIYIQDPTEMFLTFENMQLESWPLKSCSTWSSLLAPVTSDQGFLHSLSHVPGSCILNSWNITGTGEMIEWTKRQISILPFSGHYYPSCVSQKCLHLFDGVFARIAEKFSKKSFGW